MTIKEVFDALAKADLDAQLVKVFHEDGFIWVKINNVDTEEDADEES